jgi:thioester reductase-like protein
MGSWQNIHKSSVPELVSDDCSVAAAMGYGESKYIAERMLDLASHAEVKANIFRVGQISGPVKTDNRCWNKTEWFPSLVKTSKAMGVLPSSLGSMADIDWIPIDVLTDIMVEIIHSTGLTAEFRPGAKVFNLVSPHSVHFSALTRSIQEQYSIDVVQYDTWIQKLKSLEMSQQNLEKYPALKLLDFFQGITPRKGVQRGDLGFETKESQRASNTMSTLEAPSSKDIKAWLRQWAY